MARLVVSEPIGAGSRVVVAVEPVPSGLRDLLLSRRAGLRALLPGMSTGDIVAQLLERGLDQRHGPRVSSEGDW